MRLIMIGSELTTGADDSNQTKDEGEDPARATTESMTLANPDCYEERGEEDEDFEDRHAAARIELHRGSK